MLKDRILYLVDDDEGIRHATGFLLRTCGYTVRTFTSGDEFLDEADNLAPGCLLLDVRMPGSDGLAVQLDLNARKAIYPVIIMTGDGSPVLSARAYKAGAVRFIEKPFAKAELLAAVVEAFHHLLRERDIAFDLLDDHPNTAMNRFKLCSRPQMQRATFVAEEAR